MHVFISQIPMHGCNGVFEIRIKPVDWARAFNQLDFLPTIKFLYVALLTDQCRRVIDADLTARRNMLEILRSNLIIYICIINLLNTTLNFTKRRWRPISSLPLFRQLKTPKFHFLTLT